MRFAFIIGSYISVFNVSLTNIFKYLLVSTGILFVYKKKQSLSEKKTNKTRYFYVRITNDVQIDDILFIKSFCVLFFLIVDADSTKFRSST
jgi:hypothetical protein